MPRPIRAVIKASALRHNLGVAREAAGGAKIWAVVKANAYGHGLERAARALADADGFALLDYQEAARLRLAGVTSDFSATLSCGVAVFPQHAGHANELVACAAKALADAKAGGSNKVVVYAP